MAWLAENADRIEVFYLPPYAPEHNPDEYLNNDVKQGMGRRSTPMNKAAMKASLTAHMRQLNVGQTRCARSFRHPTSAMQRDQPSDTYLTALLVRQSSPYLNIDTTYPPTTAPRVVCPAGIFLLQDRVFVDDNRVRGLSDTVRDAYTSGDPTASISSNANLVVGAKVFQNLYSASTSTSLLVNGDTGTADLANNSAGVSGSFKYIGAVEVDGNYVGILVEIGDSYYLADVFESGLSGATNIKTTDTLTIQTGVGWDLTNSRPIDGPATPACFLVGTAGTHALGRCASGNPRNRRSDHPERRQDRSRSLARGPHRLHDFCRPGALSADPGQSPCPWRQPAGARSFALRRPCFAGRWPVDPGGRVGQRHQHRARAPGSRHIPLLSRRGCGSFASAGRERTGQTFVDNVDRMAFDNWADHRALYLEAPAIAEMEHHRAKARRQVPPANSRPPRRARRNPLWHRGDCCSLRASVQASSSPFSRVSGHSAGLDATAALSGVTSLQRQRQTPSSASVTRNS